MVRKTTKLAILGGTISAIICTICFVRRRYEGGHANNSPEESATAIKEYYEALDAVLRTSEERKARARKQKKYWNIWESWIPTLTLIAVIVYSLLTYFLWSDSGESVKTAQDQLAATREEQRPWLTASMENPDIRVSPRDVSFSGMLLAKNVGHLPAFDLRFFAQITVANHDNVSILEKKACAEAVSPQNPWGRAGVVFPDKESSQYVENYIPRDFLISIGVAPHVSLVRNDYGTAPVSALLHLVGCIAYRIPDDTLVHSSAFISLLGGPSPKGMKDTVIGTDNGVVDPSNPEQVSDPEGVLLMDTPSTIDLNNPRHFKSGDLHLRELSQFTMAN